MNRALFMVLGVLVVFSSVASVDAQRRPRLSAEERRARELFDHGDTLYANGNYEEAIAAFREAYEVAPRPLMLYNLANAQERAGHLADAVASLERYLPDAPAEETTVVQNRIQNLRQRVAEAEAAAAEAERARLAALEAERVPDEPPPPPPGPDLGAAIAFFVITAALGAGSAVTGGIALSERDAASPSCRTVATGTFCDAAASSHLALDEALSITTDVLLASTAVSLGLAIYFLVDALSSGGVSAEVAVNVDPRGGASFSVRAAY